MSFTQKTFAPVGPQSAPSPAVFSYSTSDLDAAITSADYFIDKSGQLSEGDLVLSDTGSGFAVYQVLPDLSSVSNVTGGITPPNTVIVTQKSDLPDPIGGVITLSIAAYEIKGLIDLGTDVLSMPTGAVINGDSTALSSITTNSATALITHDNAGSIIINGGLLLDNLGGPVIRMNHPVALAFLDLVVTRNATDFCIIDAGLVFNCMGVTVGSPFSGAVQRLITVNSSISAIIFRGVAPILQDKGCIINAGVTIGRLEHVDMIDGTSVDDFMDLNATATIDELVWNNSKVTVSAGDGLVLAGTIGLLDLNLATIQGSNSGIVLSGTLTQLLSNILSCTGVASHGFDIRGSTIDRMFFTQHFFFNVAGGFGIIGDAASANINDVASFDNGSIAGGLGSLSGIDPQDLKYLFKTNSDAAGGFVENSRNIAEAFMVASATGFTVTGSGAAFVQIGNNAGARNWATQADDRFTVATDGTITYIGLPPLLVEMSGTAIVEKSGGGTDQVCAVVYLNDTTQQSNTIGCTRNSDEAQVTCMGLTAGEIVNGDSFNIWVNNTTGAADVLVYGGSLIVKEVG